MSTYYSKAHYLKRLPENRPFMANALQPLVSSSHAHQILHRLTKAGAIQRLSRGVFFKPMGGTASINENVSFLAILEARLPRENIAIHGAEAARLLTLTTQMPMKPVFYTTGRTRSLVIKGRTIYLEHASSKLFSVSRVATLVMSALHFIGQSYTSIETIKRIENQLSTKDFQEVFQVVPLMPSWMADLFHSYLREIT